MDEYTPTFNPALSGLTPRELLVAAARCRREAALFAQLNNRALLAADRFELEAEERWLIHAANVRVDIATDGWVTAIGAQAAYRSFVKQTKELQA